MSSSTTSASSQIRIGELLEGTVVDFDFDRGLGTVAHSTVTRSEATYVFHCTAITDGSRTIEPGTAVTFQVGAAGPGHWEALEIRSH